jgi:hypothetical protein
MPWLPLAILLVAILTIAALALILFPLGEGGEQVAEDEITALPDGEMAEDNLSPPSADGDPPLRGEGEEPLPAPEPSPDLERRPS